MYKCANRVHGQFISFCANNVSGMCKRLFAAIIFINAHIDIINSYV